MLDKFFRLFSKDIAIDLGTANSEVYVRGKGVIIQEPSVVAINQKTGQILPEQLCKGHKSGQCNRSICNNDNANYYNHATRKYYCEKCARTINKSNYNEAMLMYGHELCTKSKK